MTTTSTLVAATPARAFSASLGGSPGWRHIGTGLISVVVDRVRKAQLLQVWPSEATTVPLVDVELPYDSRTLVLTRTFLALELDDSTMLGVEVRCSERPCTNPRVRAAPPASRCASAAAPLRSTLAVRVGS